MNDGKKFHHIIADARLDRIAHDARYAGSEAVRFYCDHSSLLVDGRRGDGSYVSKALLFDASSVETFGSGRILQHAAPSIMEELARGYWLAKKAGLLGPSYLAPHGRTPEFFDAPEVSRQAPHSSSGKFCTPSGETHCASARVFERCPSCPYRLGPGSIPPHSSSEGGR